MQPLYHLTDVDYDQQSLLEEAKQFEQDAPYYKDSRYEGEFVGWKIIKEQDYFLPQAKKVIEQFVLPTQCKTRYYVQDVGVDIPMHIDNNTQCSINIILTDKYAPIKIENEEYYYKQCLLNTTLEHGVFNNTTKRYLLKCTIMDMNYEDCAKHLKKIGMINDKL